MLEAFLITLLGVMAAQASPGPNLIAVAPGAETGGHVQGHDYCVVPLLDGKLEIVDPDGTSSLAELRAGESYYRPKGVHHNMINANDFDYSFVEIEFK